jgi:hypothetical protein
MYGDKHDEIDKAVYWAVRQDVSEFGVIAQSHGPTICFGAEMQPDVFHFVRQDVRLVVDAAVSNLVRTVRTEIRMQINP